MSRRYRQLALPTEDTMPAITTASSEDTAEHGEVFTRRWVADLILDLAGYRSEQDLGAVRIVEPSCGSGAFVTPIIDRLIESAEQHDRCFEELEGALRAFDLLSHNVEISRKSAQTALLAAGCDESLAIRLAESWITKADFLRRGDEPGSAAFVVGNPPYIRLEDVEDQISNEYRRLWPTMRGRADIFIGFYEKGLDLLADDGKLAFICADRWMRNQYGARLRKLISDRYAVDNVIVMHDVDAFEEKVSAYPAITVLRNGKQKAVGVVEANESFNDNEASALSAWAARPHGKAKSTRSFSASRLPTWFEGQSLWPSGSPEQLNLIADLERRFPALEDETTGTKVGIGVATGCDEVFLRKGDVEVEADRLLPMLTASDIASGTPEWSGTKLVNPWSDDGLVDLADYPLLAKYLAHHGPRVRGRNVAQRNPKAWYRTIDRVTPGLQEQRKLLLPDMKVAAHPVLDEGNYYPHHNLYYVTSRDWDLEVLGGLLLSDFANLFVGAYCVKMRGGTYRFQAQYIRKIRVPKREALSSDVCEQLAQAFSRRDVAMATAASSAAYGVRLL